MAAYPRPRARHLLLLLHAHLCLASLRAASALYFSYNFSIPGDLDRANLRYINDSSRAGDRVDLTIGNKNNSTGRVFYPEPVRLWDRRTNERVSFNVSFSFFIGSSPPNPNANTTTATTRGDGMAFFVGPSLPTLPLGFRGPFLGLFDNPLEHPSSTSPSTVGVEFDTYWNRVWDPQDIAGHDHVGIDVNSIRSTSYTRGLAKGDLSGTMSANITYDGGSKLMVVTLRLANGSTSQIQALVDFRDAGVPQDAAIGFSAATWADVNQLLSWSFSSTDPSNSSTKIQLWVILVLSAASALLAGLVVAMTCFIMMRRKRPPPPMEIELPVARKFSYHELTLATDSFSQDRKLGAGTFGAVYRGDLRDRRRVDAPVAVKKLTLLLEQTRRDYVTEIMILGQLKHRNLVKLVGWCDGGGDDKLLLVYELVTNGSLDDHLHGSSERLLTWPERYKIVLGIGSAIEYLHTGDKDAILHRDIKPSNVMLDDAFEAKLGDFGLVRQVHPGQGSLRGTAMVGSWEYMDPKCITTDSATTASDMYSFGVLLLEIATGKRPRVPRDDEELSLRNALVDAVRESYGKGAVLEMADARLNGDFDERQMERVMLVGLLCVNQDRGNRLGIREAVNLLSNLRHPLPEPEGISI
ncbi:hypothetical protein SETIT_5G434500v2 [Setaria italica]|uniref:non-specific serine/threonine protein kinase n=1 Tax=Setaria italica TaxID=4555 RepID=A0A368RFI7_SETIT|nr:L-type lectin-domain containing receptor kinase IX.2 [Setaria italica]RCV28834.1 hypothetical protein SETIT_5G434500v2 [Setaria italica]